MGTDTIGRSTPGGLQWDGLQLSLGSWEAYGRGSLPLHILVSDSANPHYVSDPLPQSFVGSS